MFPSLVGPPGPPGGPNIFVPNYALLRLINPLPLYAGYVANVGGNTSIADGGEGMFEYIPTSTDDDDNGTILTPSNPIGRWRRIFDGLNFWVPWFGALSQVALGNNAGILQGAINAASVNGGIVRVPAGTFQVATQLLITYSNVSILGAGLDATTITADNSFTQSAESIGTPYGILEINRTVSQPNRIYNIRVADISFKQLTILPNEPFNSPAYNRKVIFFETVTNLTIERVGIINGNGESLSSAGIVGLSPQNVYVTNCFFTGSQFNSLDFNDRGSGHVITNNIVRDAESGLVFKGYDCVIANNVLVDVRRGGISVNEATYNLPVPVGTSIIVTNNTLQGCGTGNTTTPVTPISAYGGATKYADGEEDSAMLVIGNTIRNTVVDTNQGFGIVVNGNVLVEGNLITGITSGAVGNTQAIKVQAGSVGPGAASSRTFLKNNVVDPISPYWDIGLQINALTATSSVYCSGNDFLGCLEAIHCTAGGLQFVSLNADRINGIIVYAAKWTGAGGGSINGFGEFNGQPISGDSAGTLSCPISGDILQHGNSTVADTTPSVKTVGNGTLELTSATPRTITQFDDGVQGQVITLYFLDGNTTIDDNYPNIVLDGSVNWNAPAGSSLTLKKVSNAIWLEVGRMTR